MARAACGRSIPSRSGATLAWPKANFIMNFDLLEKGRPAELRQFRLGASEARFAVMLGDPAGSRGQDNPQARR
jgi:hypothetical protein